MAKKSAKERNEKRKGLVAKHKAQREALKRILKDPNLSDEEFYTAQRKLAKLPRNSSSIRVRNRCSITGRPRGFKRKYGVSRIVLREYVSRGLIPGATKSSW